MTEIKSSDSSPCIITVKDGIHYEIIGANMPEEFAWVDFQNGPIKEKGVNGCQIEDLLAISLHRLEGFQSGNLACFENQVALSDIKRALDWLNFRTNQRIKRGVEGKYIK